MPTVRQRRRSCIHRSDGRHERQSSSADWSKDWGDGNTWEGVPANPTTRPTTTLSSTPSFRISTGANPLLRPDALPAGADLGAVDGLGERVDRGRLGSQKGSFVRFRVLFLGMRFFKNSKFSKYIYFRSTILINTRCLNLEIIITRDPLRCESVHPCWSGKEGATSYLQEGFLCISLPEHVQPPLISEMEESIPRHLINI